MLTLSNIRLVEQKLRELFLEIKKKVNENLFFASEMKLLEISIEGSVTNHRIPHHMGFKPTDAFTTRSTGATLTWNYALFDETFLDVSTNGSVEVRALIGKLRGTNAL